MLPGTARRILVIKLRHIGDVLLTVPALRAIRARFPGAHLTVLVNAGTEAMLTDHPLIDEVIVFDRHSGERPWTSLVRQWSFLRVLRARRVDMTIDLTSGDRAAFLAWWSGAETRIAFETRAGMWGKRRLWSHTTHGPSFDRHTVLQNLELVEAFGMTTADRRVDLYWTAADDAVVDGWWAQYHLGSGDPVVQVHPTSRWLFKCWDEDKNARVIDSLQERGFRVIVTSGPAPYEVEKAERIVNRCRLRPPALLGRTTLKQLAALTARCRLFFGVDSAPMHMAAAVNTPVVAIMWRGSTTHWRPWGEGHTVVEAATPDTATGSDRKNQIIAALATIQPETIIRLVERRLAELASTAKAR